MSIYPRLVTTVTAMEGRIGPYPSIQYAVQQLLYTTVQDIHALAPLTPVNIIQEEKNRQISETLSNLAGSLKYSSIYEPSTMLSEFKKIGKWISDYLFVHNCLCCWNGGLPQTVEIITNQHEIPWELTWIQDDFLAKQTIHARYPFVSKTRHSSISYSTPPRLAIIRGRSDGLTLVDEEISGIREAYQKKFSQEISLFSGEEVNVNLIRQLLSGQDSMNAFDIIHFIGHGNAQYDQVWLELSGPPFLDHNIPQIMSKTPLIFWNSCLGATTLQARYRYQADVIDAFGGKLLSSGASHFIGSVFPIFDTTAKEFAVNFYSNLFDGNPIGKAFYEAKVALYNMDPVVLTYVLYGNPEVRIAHE